ERRTHVHFQLRVDVHPRPQLKIGIWNIDANLGRAFRRVEKRINQTDSAVEVLARIRLCGDGELLPPLKHRQLVLVKFCTQSDDAEIGNLYKKVSRIYTLAMFNGH